MSSTWAIVIGVVLILFLVNAVFAYRYRSRQLRAMGQEPPSFFVYLFFPKPLPRRVPMPRLLRVALGLIIFSGGVLFVLVGAILLTASQTEFAHPVAAVVVLVLLTALGAFFGYVGLRLIAMRTESEPLFHRATKRNDAA